jgi:hypothetical protein
MAIDYPINQRENQVIRPGTLAFITLVLLLDASGQQQVEEKSRTQTSTIAPGFAIVTELSTDTLYVGQQFSVLYRLEASKPPVAVDIDPQQFSGCWSEIAPLRENPSAHDEPPKRNSKFQYLLRQVVAFPLLKGPLQLPPLQVKIKTSESSLASSDDWDLVRASDSVTIHVAAPPKSKEPRDAFPLVGSVEGKISEVRRGERNEAVLEMWGTANLDLFQATQWMQSAGNVPLSVKLQDRENTIQTQDTGGRRRISLLQRRRWTIRPFWNGPNELKIADIDLPVFDAQSASWGIKRIEGIGLRKDEAGSRVPERFSANGPKPKQKPNGSGSAPYKYLLWIGGFLVLIMMVITLKYLGGRNPH